jgi:hypothetical protein
LQGVSFMNLLDRYMFVILKCDFCFLHISDFLYIVEFNLCRRIDLSKKL